MIAQKGLFHVNKWLRMAKYHIRYRVNKWKKIGGIYLPVYLRYGYSVLRFIDNETYECEELKIVKSKLKQSDTVLELGTGIGFIATACAQKIGSDKVYTYEANYLMKPVIRELFNKNKVYPHFEIAFVGRIDSEFISVDNFLESSSKINKVSGYKINVPSLSLNKEILRINPTYLIMDIEGNEYDVLKEIEFHNIKKIQLEIHPWLLSQEQVDFIFKRLDEDSFVLDKEISTNRNLYLTRE